MIESKSLKNSSGFTLIEILIAITILSFLMVGVFTIINNSTDTKDKITLEDQEYLQVESALYRIELDFALFYSPLFHSTRYVDGAGGNARSNFNNNDEENFETDEVPVPTSVKKFRPSEKFDGISRVGIPIPTVVNEDKSSLIFMTSNNKRKFENSKQSNFAWVRYVLENNDEEDEEKKKGDYMLVRQYTSTNPYTTDFSWDDVKSHVLMRNLKSLTFNFWDPNKKEFTDRLRNTNSDGSLMRILKVMIEWVDVAGIENNTERSFRVIWPFFDTEKDYENYLKAFNRVDDQNEGDPDGQ